MSRLVIVLLAASISALGRGGDVKEIVRRRVSKHSHALTFDVDDHGRTFGPEPEKPVDILLHSPQNTAAVVAMQQIVRRRVAAAKQHVDVKNVAFHVDVHGATFGPAHVMNQSADENRAPLEKAFSLYTYGPFSNHSNTSVSREPEEQQPIGSATTVQKTPISRSQNMQLLNALHSMKKLQTSLLESLRASFETRTGLNAYWIAVPLAVPLAVIFIYMHVQVFGRPIRNAGAPAPHLTRSRSEGRSAESVCNRSMTLSNKVRRNSLTVPGASDSQTAGGSSSREPSNDALCTDPARRIREPSPYSVIRMNSRNPKKPRSTVHSPNPMRRTATID